MYYFYVFFVLEAKKKHVAHGRNWAAMSPPLKRNHSQFQSSSTTSGSKRNGKKSIRLALATVPSTTMTAQDEVS
jgi:hypothetical protein